MYPTLFQILRIFCSIGLLYAISDDTRSSSYQGSSAMSYTINPGCDIPQCLPSKDNKTSLNLLHVKVPVDNETVHFLWSTYKLPTVIISKTGSNVKLKVDWNGLLNFKEKAISFSETPSYSVALVIKEIWQFFDEKDLANIENGNNVTSLSMSDLFWSDMNSTLNFMDTFISAFPYSWSTDELFSQGGLISIKFSASANVYQSNDFPHLWYTSGSSQLKLQFIGLDTFDKKNRFAAEMVAISSFHGNSVNETEWTNDEIVSINDEYSPGVFKINRLFSSPPAGEDEGKGFVVWKPVAYIGATPTVANSSDAKSSEYLNKDISVSDSIVLSYFDGNFSALTWNLTFGSSGDGFYTKTKHTSWSVMVGVGDPIMEKMSLLAIVVTAVGLGMPFLIVLLGASFLGYKKLRQKNDVPLLVG